MRRLQWSCQLEGLGWGCDRAQLANNGKHHSIKQPRKQNNLDIFTCHCWWSINSLCNLSNFHDKFRMYWHPFFPLSSSVRPASNKHRTNKSSKQIPNLPKTSTILIPINVISSHPIPFYHHLIHSIPVNYIYPQFSSSFFPWDQKSSWQ